MAFSINPNLIMAHDTGHKVESYHKEWRFDRSGMTSITQDTLGSGVWFELSCPPVNNVSAVADYTLYIPSRDYEYLDGSSGRITIGSYFNETKYFAIGSAVKSDDWIIVTFDFKKDGKIDIDPINFIKGSNSFFVGFEGGDYDPILSDFSGAGSASSIGKGHCGE